MLSNCLAVGLGGFVGAVLRYLVGLIPLGAQPLFPIKTFLVNLIGAFAIGLIVALAAKNSALDPRLVLFLKVGICGGFTTFSTFALETMDLLQAGHVGVALAYAVVSVVACVLAVFAGQLLVK